ncbi:F-box protein At5g46170-like [Phragmites australis]|uniref:F-box protein At5g46170-like n=1 Tax=Phragmites australis TaxID=29695 RepID=UPI002D79DD5F|nr:F-box protein At5g46170-like [Phragmites australis]
MQSKHRIFAEDLLLAAEGEDHFDPVPDSLVLLIFNKVADARSLGRCSAVSRRFNALVPLVDDACLRIDRVITDADDALGLAGPRPRGVLSHLFKAMFLAVLKPFAHCDAKSSGSHAKHAAQQHHSPAQVLKNFSSIRNLRMELPVSDVGTDDGVLLKWKAVFGSTLQSCVILGGTRVDRAGPHAHAHAPSAAAADPESADDSGSIPESFYTNGGLKLRVVWTISSLIAAATRHYLLREIVKEHPTLERVALTDAHGQGTLSMGRDQLKEFRDKPLAAAAAANRSQVPACNMKLRYAPLLELSDGTRIHGATLVVIKPVGEAGGIGGGRKDLDEFVAGAFDGPFREAVGALSKRRTYLLEMNGF